MNIAMLLDMAADACGDRTAVVCGQQSLTFSELRELAQRAAMHIRASGASHVALLDVNSPAVPVTLFGAAYAGVPYVPLNYRLTQPEIQALLARVSPALLVVGDDFGAGLEVAGVTALASAQIMNLSAGESFSEGDIDPTQVAVQLFTSGTTGTPKAALLRHENLTAYILGTVEFMAASEEDAVLVTVPPYHVAGISAVLSSTYACRRMAQMASFEPRAWLQLAADEGVSNAFVVPTMLSRIIETLDDGSRLPRLRAVAYGGGKMPQTTIAKAMKLLPQVDFTNAYGLTETSSTICVLTPDDHRAAASASEPAVRRRLSSVGRPTDAVEVSIRDEAGQNLTANQPGMIFVRGGQVAGEYKEQGSQLSADGWFCTRDIGFLDDDGYLFLDGRADDVIVRGGENISPGEVEDVLLGHPAVADVAVVAMPDEEWGEAVAAAVVLKAGCSVPMDELQTLVRDKLRSSRVPQSIIFKPELPYNELGKVLRRVIRDELAQSTPAA